MGRKALSTLLLLSAVALAADAEAPYTLQPVTGERGVEITGDGARAWAITADGASRRLPLEPGELPTAVAETADGWVAAGLRREPERRELFVIEAGIAGPRRLSPPPGADVPLRVRPVPMIDNGRLAGLAWLEGSEPGRFAVRAAVRRGDGWGATETVARRGRGSQTGLTGVVLPDGSWLLVWAAHDGRDDEIVFAERRDDAWSRPQRIHAANRVPDVTPALVAVGSGALAAWSRLEEGAGYRVQLASFDGNRWRERGPAASADTLYPSFVRRAGRQFLLARSAAPRGWEVVEIDDDGAGLRTARVAGAPAERPALDLATGGAARLRWPQQPGARAIEWSER